MSLSGMFPPNGVDKPAAPAPCANCTDGQQCAAYEAGVKSALRNAAPAPERMRDTKHPISDSPRRPPNWNPPPNYPRPPTPSATAPDADEIMAKAKTQTLGDAVWMSKEDFAALRAAVERVVHERDDAEGAFRVWKGRTERAERERDALRKLAQTMYSDEYINEFIKTDAGKT